MQLLQKGDKMICEKEEELCPLMKKGRCIRRCMFFDGRLCRVKEAIEDIHSIAAIIIEKNIDVTPPYSGDQDD